MSSDDLVRMKARAGVHGASYDGRWYPSTDGFVLVPRSAVPALTHFLHGFTLTPDEPAKTLTLAKVRKMR